MIGLGYKDNSWGFVLDYNDNLNFAVYVVLMLYNVYVIIIYAGKCLNVVVETYFWQSWKYN